VETGLGMTRELTPGAPSYLDSFPDHFRVLVVGASGGIGAAMVETLHQQRPDAQIESLHRHSEPKIDFADENSIARAAQVLNQRAPFHLIINAAGVLHTSDFMPEKKLDDLHYAQLRATFEANTFGPALLLRYLTPLLDRQRGVMVMLSAKVGSIEDNRLGGWYSYRASKAALNMLIKTAAIELRRTQPNSVLLALHPGTVSSSLSKPFRGATTGRPAMDAARDMLQVINTKTPEHSGMFYTYGDEKLPW
jgi:NAD(P)-dependent dehydrogenase (short-subunit alcohol dehydrogenase family)